MATADALISLSPRMSRACAPRMAAAPDPETTMALLAKRLRSFSPCKDNRGPMHKHTHGTRTFKAGTAEKVAFTGYWRDRSGADAVKEDEDVVAVEIVAKNGDGDGRARTRPDVLTIC